MAEETREKTNFIWEAIKADIAEGKNGGRVQTRFPPEPHRPREGAVRRFPDGGAFRRRVQSAL